MFIAEAIVHKDKRWKSIIHVIAIIVIAHLIGVFLLMDTKIQEEEDTKIALIQPCFPQEMKFDPIWYEDMVHWAIQYIRQFN
jgi:apolipoprotein N-acyltransferase